MLKSLKDGTFSELVQGLPFFGRRASSSRAGSVRLLDPVKPAISLLQVVGQGRGYSELVALEASGEIFQQRVLYTVQAIVLEAIEFEAKEVFIGHPREYLYEFFVNDIGYQGLIEPSDYLSLLRLFGKDSELEFFVEHFEIEALSLSLTSNHSNPVVHVGWRHRWVDVDSAPLRLAQ